MKFVKHILASMICKNLFDKRCNFQSIICHDDIKHILNRALISERPAHILLVGRPGSAKSRFLTEIMHNVKQSYFIVGSNTTKAGLVNQLFERRPKFLLVDELDKMAGVDQNSLLHLMETGIISETKIKKTRRMEITSWVFATANSCEKVIEPLLSRFVILQIPDYTFEEFIEISAVSLAKEKVDRNMAEEIAENLWDEGLRDIRDVIKVARLAKNVEEVSSTIKILKRYSRLGKKADFDFGVGNYR